LELASLCLGVDNHHFHLVLRTPAANLSTGMHDLNSGYASLLNRRYRRVGSLEFKHWIPRHFQVSAAIFWQARRHGNDARIAGIYLVRRLTDQKVAALAEDFGAVSMAAISKAVARAEWRKQEDPKWNRLITNLERKLLEKKDGEKLNVKT